MKTDGFRYKVLLPAVAFLVGILANGCQKDSPAPESIPLKDGEYIVVHEASVAKPVKMLFLGDGYIQEDYSGTGKFLSDVREGIAELFAVEPYKTYEKYFQIYAVAAYSAQRGMTIPGEQERDTKFQVRKVGTGATALECNEDEVFKYSEYVPEVKGNLEQTTIFLLSNEDIYCGTCYLYHTGESIAIIPVSRKKDESMYVDFGSILRHEGGGHAFAYCADEYVTHDGEALPQTGEHSLESAITWQALGKWENISVDPESVLWSELMGVKGYEAITNPEGGLYYSYGVWRSEENSCMIDNRPYFNAAQRLAIVKRIKERAGEEFSLQDFIKNDVVKSPPPSQESKSSISSGHFVPLTPPVLN